jgi:hypothetical protein
MQYWYFDEGGEFLEARRDSLENRFIVDFNLGAFYTGVWLNILQINHPAESSEEISQRYFGWREDNLTVHLGNYYHAFDRGLTLNAFLDDVVYFDNNLDGVIITGHYDWFEFDALSGRGLNSFSGEREYTLRGVRGALRPIMPVKVGFSYVRFKQNSSDFFRPLNANLTSVNSSISRGPLDLYAEYAVKKGRDDPFLLGANLDGDGTYLSGSISLEKISLYSEYKNYVNLMYPVDSTPFNNPPPASHQGRTLTSLSAVPGERGYQAGLLVAPTFDINFDIAYSESFSRNTPAAIGRLYLAEKYAGLRLSLGSDLVLNYSWDRIDWTEEDEIENYFDGYYYIGESRVLSLTAYTRRFLPPLSEDYHEDYLTLGYGEGGLLLVNIGGSVSNYDIGRDPKKMAFVEITLRLRSHELIVFNGGERGGLICSSGICQERPTFEGTRIILFSRF